MVSRRSLLVGLVAAASLTPFGSRRVRRVAARTINKLIKPTDPFVRVGKTVPLETFRANVVNEVYSGAGVPTATGFASSDLNTSDPLIAYSLHPANLAQYDQHTQQIKDNNNNNVGEPIIVGVWRPSSGTKNNKLVIQMLGHLPLSSLLDPNDPDHPTDGNLVKLLVEGGYTVAVCEMPSHGDLDSHSLLPRPTASLNPLRYFTDSPIKAINTLLPEGFNSNVLYCGHSGGGWVGPLLMAMDTRIRAGCSNAGYFPLYIWAGRDRDYEQFLPGLSDNLYCDYLDLIVLACTGGSNGARTLIESHGDQDPCCFYKAEYDAAPYFDYMASVVASYGGTYQGVFDSNMSHNYSPSRRTAIKTLFDTY